MALKLTRREGLDWARMGESEDRRWKVGALARATGLTVRALHHYDDVGLLVPWERTAAGHRLYAAQEVRRLYQILALRRLGLRLEEIASLLDDDASLVETVRRHLEQVERDLEHQQLLRRRLRQILDSLERSVEPSVGEFLGAMEAMTVIEAVIEDVVMRIPPDEPDEPPPRLTREGYRVVLLRERDGERVLPIWIGAYEGDLLAARLGDWSQNRPMGPDLTVQLLQAGDVQVERVVITHDDMTFYATVTVSSAGESHEIDARPSDAVNLAVRVAAPVYVAAEVIDRTGVQSGPFAFPRGGGEAGEWDDQWRSLSPELMRSLHPREARIGFERYTRPARLAMSHAHDEARALGHDHVGPEHLLLGLLRAEEGLAARVLERLDITLERVRAQSGQGPRPGEEAAPGPTPYTPKTQKAIELAHQEETTRRPNRLGTEHLLLGLMGADEQALVDFGASAERVREEVEALTTVPADDSAPERTPPPI